MDNEMSVAVEAVARGPATVAPPSFDGHGWLVVLNLAEMTAATVIAGMGIAFIVSEAWKGRARDRGLAPARVHRIIGLLLCLGMLLRCGAEAASLWGWNPLDPQGTAALLILKRFIDPLAVPLGVTAIGLYVMSFPGMREQLRKEPLPIDMWQSWPVIQRMAGVAVLSLIAAVGMVSTR